MPSLHIRTTPPGPRARMLLRRSERYVAPSATQSYPLVVDHAAGCHVWDVDGNCYLDFTAAHHGSLVGNWYQEGECESMAPGGPCIPFFFSGVLLPCVIRLGREVVGL